MRGGKDGKDVEVLIKGSGPLKPVTTALANPERIVIDLPNARCDPREIPVNAGDVGKVSVQMLQEDPPVARIELELSLPHAYELVSAGKMATVRIGAPLPQTEDTKEIAEKPPQAAGQSLESGPAAAEPPAAPVPDLLQLQIADVTATPDRPPAQIAEQLNETSPAQQGQGEPPNVVVPARIEAVAAPAPARQPARPSSDFEGIETTVHQSAKGQLPGIVQSITVSRDKDAAELHIEADQLLHPSVTLLTNPERIVIDLPNVGLHHALSLKFDGGDVRDVVASIYLVNPLVTRVVVNLDRSYDYHVRESGPEVTVHIEGAQLGKERKAKYHLVGHHDRP